MLNKEEEFVLSEERKKIPKIVNITDAVSYHTGVCNALEIVKEQDKEFIRLLKEITKDCMSGGCDEEVVMGRINKIAGEKLK